MRKKLQPLLFFVCLFLFCYFVFACGCFCCFLVAYFCFDSFFLLVSVFVRVKSFCKNKLNKQAENCLDSLNYLYYSRTSAYQVVKIVCFSGNLACFVFCYLRFEIGPFTLLPTICKNNIKKLYLL